MFRLLIADDEQLEREALRFIISKSIDSISTIEEAVNGREAIVKAQSSKPEIIILDINMPGINGIEAAWKIREENESVCIIFLTAFHQFDYAHEAIKVGVEDYIVKPSSEKRIIEVMEKVTSKLLDKMEQKQKSENVELRLDRVTDYLSSEFIYKLVTRNLEEEKFRNYLTMLNMNFHRGRGMIMKLNFKSYPILASSEIEKQILKRKCLRRVKDQFSKHNLISYFNMDLNNIFILMFCDRYNGLLESEELLQRTIQSITDNIKENLNITVLLEFGSLFDAADSANKSYREAKKNLSKTNDSVLFSTSEEGFPIDLEMDLEQAVFAADKKNLERQFNKLEEWIQSSSTSFDDKKNSIMDLTVILRHSAAIQFPKGECRLETGNIQESESVIELLTAFWELLNDLLDMIVTLFARENIPVIKKACKYIKENYERDISLEDTAAYCNLSTFYFSKIFKEHKKTNFINYLTDIRINEAKRLLKETDLSMKEISGRIGYRDPNYFARVFKRVENYSPRYFRNNKMLQKQ